MTFIYKHYFNPSMDKTFHVPKKTFKLGQDEYDIYPREAVAGARAVEYAWKKFGQPQDPFSTSGAKVMEVIIAVWEDLYPKDAFQFYEERKDYRSVEMSTAEQVRKHTGRSLASYPLPIYQMMKKVFRGFEPAERNNCLKMVRKWPQFQMANKA